MGEEWRAATRQWVRKVKVGLGGMDALVELLVPVMADALSAADPGTPTLTGALVCGPTGVGKSLLIETLQRHAPGTVGRVKIDCTTLFGKRVGDAEAALFEAFQEVWSKAPAVCVLEEVESIGRKDLGSVTAQRLRALLCRLLDTPSSRAGANGRCFFVATCRDPSLIDEALVQGGRLELLVPVDPPSAAQRLDILSHLTRRVVPADKKGSRHGSRRAMLEAVATKAQCFVGADLNHLTREAFHVCLRRCSRLGGAAPPGSAAPPAMSVTKADFEVALSLVRPASVMTGSDFVPQDPPGEGIAALGGVDEAWERLAVAVVQPVRALANGTPSPEMAILRKIGVGAPRGVLIHGPSGTGKTKLALALATELRRDARFMNVPCTDLVRAEHGSSEKAIAAVFAAARRASPCVLLLDQVEVIAQRRSIGADGPAQAAEHTMDRILSLLLVEVDGAASGAEHAGREGSGAGLVIVATTHDVSLIEPALLRPGRLDQHIATELPDLAARRDIFSKLLAKMPLSLHSSDGASGGGGRLLSDADVRVELIDHLARETAGASCADLERACQEAALEAIRQEADGLTRAHFFASMIDEYADESVE